jgi:GntR family transcriptional regulator/MocR family aminotransferase
MILIQVDKTNTQPLFQQVFEQLKQMIELGVLQSNEHLPSTRKLAEMLGVHRTTIYRAYEELWAAGYLEATAGSYSRVRRRNLLASQPTDEEHSLIDWENCISEAAGQLQDYKTLQRISTATTIDFAPLSPDSELLPVDDFRHCLNHVLLNNKASLLQYGSPLGYQPLRVYLANQMRQHGIATQAGEIMLTNGMQNGIDLVLKLLTNPGDCIVTESPSYASALSLMRYLGLQIVGIPMTTDGMNLELLEIQLKKHRPKLIYTMPTFQNPTGLSTSQTHREQLLALCEKYRVPLVEDGFEEEMKYFGKAVLPIKSMDKNRVVIYLGTFSKILFPGIRVGWIVAPAALIAKMGNIKRVSEISGSPLVQAAVHQFCQQGFYELHKKRLHRVYRKRMQTALLACREFLSTPQIQWTKPDGGYLIWISLKTIHLTEDELITQLAEAGITVSPGSRFFPEPNNEVHFRLSIAHRNEDEIREGIRRIGEILKTRKQ